MGNCQCRPREDGESLKEFLARKFHNISGKRKIDDHVTIAIHDEREKSGLTRDVVETGKADEEDNQMEAMELLDLEDITDSEDEHSLDSDGRTSSNQRQLDQCEMSADLDEKTEYDEQEKLSRQDVFEPKEDNDQIRVLQHQLQQVQDQLANLQRGKSSSGESMNTCTDKGESMNTCTDKGESMNTCTDKGESSGVHSFLSQQLDEIEEMPALLECETYNHVETIRHRTHRERFLHAQGDTRDSMDEQLNDEHMEMTTVTGVKEVNGTKTSQITSDDKGDAGVKDDGRAQKNYRRNKMHGMITEGLRTRTSVNIPRNKVLVSRKECTHNKKAAKDTNTVLDKTKVAAKIAALQKRDPERRLCRNRGSSASLPKTPKQGSSQGQMLERRHTITISIIFSVSFPPL